MTASDVLQCQNDIVTTMANAIRHRWHFVAVNIEIDDIDGEQTENCIVLAYTKKFWKLIRTSHELPSQSYNQFSELRKRMSACQDQPWHTCTLVFNNDGRYRFAFAYDPPLRLNGVHNDQSMLTSFDPKGFLDAATE